jgi:hypothetical protein
VLSVIFIVSARFSVTIPLTLKDISARSDNIPLDKPGRLFGVDARKMATFHAEAVV